MNQRSSGYLYMSTAIDSVRKRALVFIMAANLVSIFMILFGLSPLTNQVGAWCDAGSNFSKQDITSNECVTGNLSEIEKLPADRALKTSDYESKIKSCAAANAGGIDAGIDSPLSFIPIVGGLLGGRSEEGYLAGCANAILTCQKYAIEASDCTDNNVKTIAGRECNYGRLSSDGSNDCQRLKEINGTYIDKIAESACVGEPDNAAGAKATNDCKSAVNSQCMKGDILNNDGTLNGNGFEDAKKCAANESRKQAQSQEVCEARDGVYVGKDTQDPDTSLPDDKRNKLSKGCYYQASDLTNSEACKAANKGYVWQRTGGGTSSDDYGCVDLSNPDGKDNDKDNPDAVCLKAADGKTCITGSLEGGTKQCGQASTNIIGCGSDQGATALSNVLRIFVIVLTFGVGIAAVASIAYSAIRYAGARDNQSDVSLARERIRNVVIGLLLYGFLIAIANWLVPGGIF